MLQKKTNLNTKILIFLYGRKYCKVEIHDILGKHV